VVGLEGAQSSRAVLRRQQAVSMWEEGMKSG